MITGLIDWSLDNRFLVLLLSAVLAGWGLVALRDTPVDAIPDLSDVQVIIRTPFAGQAPQVVEDQVTYPLTTAMLSVPGAVTVRGYSFFGDSFVYVIFEDGTDLYWARSRVLEYLNQVADTLPSAAKPGLGPDATGVGWVYEYALVDRSGNHDLAQLRSIQDYFLKIELQTVPGVAEVATIGGMVRQYQVTLDPDALQAHNLSVAAIRQAIEQSSQEVGGSVIEMAEAEYMVRATGYIDSTDDLRATVLKVSADGAPVLLADVATIGVGPAMRRGIAELDGEGEVVGGVVVMRFGENARSTIDQVKARLSELSRSLPEGVEVVETYDRSGLIKRSVETLKLRLIEEFIVVVLVCLLFLFHLRSSLVIVISLPLGVLVAFIVMRAQGLNANIMSLGGIAIAVGAMVDAAIVMIENLHKRMERADYDPSRHWETVRDATVQVGPPLFFSLLIITVSFLPVFTLEAQEGRMFAPLAYTKTYAMAAAAALSITLVPVLMGYFIRGRIVPEHRNPLNRGLMGLYRPVIRGVIRAPWFVVAASVVILALSWWPATQLGSEFMPELDEGDLMYMPTTFPGLSAGKAGELLQQTDKLIATVPEVERVFGKIGRADTATDPAPMTMIETIVRLKPRDQWREGVTLDDIKAELNQRVNLPGVTNAWVWPIKTRIDMLATGIKTPVGIKIAGPDLDVISDIGEQIETVLEALPGTASAFSERVSQGRYITVDIDRMRAARHGLTIADIQEVIGTAVGGRTIAESVEGLERYPINLRFPRGLRDSPQALGYLPLMNAAGHRIALSSVADIRIESGPPMIKSENARLNGWIYVDINDSDLGGYVERARDAVFDSVDLPPGYSIQWAGQFEYLQRARERLSVVVPLTLVLIVLLLYLNFRSVPEVLIIMCGLPFALVGSVWLLYGLDYNLSVAVGVGFIALSGVAAETGVIMLVYLQDALAVKKQSCASARRSLVHRDLADAVMDGAVSRLRPKIMTVATIIVGLLPIMLGSGTGSEIMRRIAAPMVGGMVSAMILTLVVIPAIFLIWQRRFIAAG